MLYTQNRCNSIDQAMLHSAKLVINVIRDRLDSSQEIYSRSGVVNHHTLLSNISTEAILCGVWFNECSDSNVNIHWQIYNNRSHSWFSDINYSYTHTHTHTHIYIYIYINCVIHDSHMAQMVHQFNVWS